MNPTTHITSYNKGGHLFVILLVLGILIHACPTEATNLLTIQPVTIIPEFKEGAPELAELLPRVLGLSERRVALEKMLMALPDMADMETRLNHLKNQIQTQEKLLRQLKTLRVSASRQLASINADLQTIAQRFNKSIKYLTNTFAELETYRQFWINEKQQWESWQSILPEPDRKRLGLDPLFAAAHENYHSAQDMIAQAREQILSIQRLVIDIQDDISTLDMNITRTRVEWKATVSHRAISPPLFSLQYLQQYSPHLLKEIKWGWKSITLPGLEFLRKEKWVMGSQLALLFFLVWLISRNQTRIEQRYPDHYFTRRPFSTGILVSMILLASYYRSADPMLHLILVTVIGFSGARLAPGFATRKWGAQIFYIVAFLAVMTILLPWLGIPLPLIRLSVFSGAVLVLILSIWLYISVYKSEKSKFYLWMVGFSAFMMCIVLFLEIIGDSARSSHLFSAIVETFFLIMVFYMMMVMIQGVVELVMRSPTVNKIEYLRGKINTMITPAVWGIRLVIGFLVGSYLLETWSVAESAVDAMQKILSLGVSIGTFKLTVGLVVTVAACFMGSIVLSHAIQMLLSETTYKKHQLEYGVRVSISKIVHYSFVFSGFLLVLYVLGVEMKSITIIGGALGVGIGFGLQGIVRNFISGLILLFERPVKVGDYVTMEGQWGEIKSLGLRSTVVQTFDYSEIVVPNHDLIEQKVVNWTLSDRLMRIIVKVGVAYGSDVERVKQTLLECAMMSSKVTRMPEPQALFMKFGDSSLNFELRVWISNIDDYVSVTSFLHEEIDKRFKNEGITIAFPQRDVHMHTAEKPDGPK